MLPFHKMQPPVLEASCIDPLIPSNIALAAEVSLPWERGAQGSTLLLQ